LCAFRTFCTFAHCAFRIRVDQLHSLVFSVPFRSRSTPESSHAVGIQSREIFFMSTLRFFIVTGGMFNFHASNIEIFNVRINMGVFVRRRP